MGFVFALLLSVLLPLYDRPDGTATYDHRALTHYSEDPAADRLLAEAIVQWGFEDGGYGGDITAVYGFTYGTASARLFERDGVSQSCLIMVHPEIRQDLAIHPGLFTHEVGHCLGLGHPGDVGGDNGQTATGKGQVFPSVMGTGSGDPSGIDRLVIAVLYH